MQRQATNPLMGMSLPYLSEAYCSTKHYDLIILISRGSPVQSGTPPPNPTSCLDSILVRTSYSSRRKDSLSCSIHNTQLRRPAVAERHSNSTHTVRRLNGSSHRDRRFGAGPPFHSLNRRRRVACQPYTLGSTWDTSFVFGRMHRLHTADINPCPPLRPTRFRHSRIGIGTALARCNSPCILRTCPFKKSTVRSKSTSRSPLKNLPVTNILPSLPS